MLLVPHRYSDAKNARRWYRPDVGYSRRCRTLIVLHPNQWTSVESDGRIGTYVCYCYLLFVVCFDCSHLDAIQPTQQIHPFCSTFILSSYNPQWVGPIRRIHSVNIESEDGQQTPYRAMLKFKPGTKTLKISTTGSHEFPLEFGAEVPNANRMKDTWAATQKVFDVNPKVTIQGGSTEGGGGCVRYFNIPDDVETTQLVLWSRDVGKRTVKCKIEVLQGPNSVRQLYDLHCGGSTQPYHAVIPTPGPGWTIRIMAVNYMEFPFEAVVEPYEKQAYGSLEGSEMNFNDNGQMW